MQLGPLRTLLSLSQLSVEDNFITSFDGLQTLRSLMELYIGNNRIPALKVGWLWRLVLTCLCTYLVGACVCVCVLRMNMNLRQDIRDLKDLPKLIIVDMTGNPLVAAEDYRLYTVYFLRKLKVRAALGNPVSLTAYACLFQSERGRGCLELQHPCSHCCDGCAGIGWR